MNEIILSVDAGAFQTKIIYRALRAVRGALAGQRKLYLRDGTSLPTVRKYSKAVRPLDACKPRFCRASSKLNQRKLIVCEKIFFRNEILSLKDVLILILISIWSLGGFSR